MYTKIPKSITTTEIQRNPSILQKLNKRKEMRTIIRESKQIGVFTPIKVHNELIARMEELEALVGVAEAMAEVEEAKKHPKGLDSLTDADEFFSKYNAKNNK